MNKYLGIIATILFSSMTYILTSLSVFGQVDCDTTKYQKLLNNSYQYKWIYFQAKETIEGTVIKHEKQIIGCGKLATASLTIIKTENDTIRVLDLCNQDDFKVGQKVKIIPRTEPKFQVHIPSYIFTSGQQKKKITKKEKEDKKITEKELTIWHTNEYDLKILRTTWGNIIIE